MCAKLIHHAGIKKVILLAGGYGVLNGKEYLEQNGIPCEEVDNE
jgi:dCMP deaminase|tara:strand:+ start:951 stop:1082 length:132 start_codon:yes stop_codon:yes gene_type:complete